MPVFAATLPFLAPIMLLGGIAAAIPIILHFFYRARYKPMPWAAMRFLKMAVEQTSRRLKFQELLLLIIRVLLMLLLAVALARFKSCSTGSAGSRGEAVDAIFVIDISYSMNARDGSKTKLQIAKESALKVIDELPPNSTVQVITIADKAVAAGPKSPRNLDQAKLLITNLTASQQATDYLDGFTEAIAAMSRAEGASKEVYLFGDMQRTAWEKQSSAIRAKCEEIKGQATLFVVRCGGSTTKNVAVLDVRPQTTIPHTDSRLPFTVMVKNTGSEAVNGVSVSLSIDGEKLNSEEVVIEKIAPGETKPITITGKIEKAGWKVLTAGIKPNTDQLDDDNTFERLILVREKVKVLIVDGSPNAETPDASASFALGHALLPIADDFKAKYHVQVDVVAAADVAPGNLTDREVCILANVPLAGPNALGEDFIKALPDFVKSGKSILITAGANVKADAYNRALGSGGIKLLPRDLDEPFVAPKDAKDGTIFPDPDSIDLQSFLGTAKMSTSNPLSLIRDAFILKAMNVRDGEEGDRARVLLKYNNGKPCLITKQTDDGGEVMLLTTSPDKDWGYLATSIPFPPFINGIVTHMVDRSASGYNKIAGETIRYTPKASNGSFDLLKPDQSRVRLGKPQGGNQEKLALTISDTSKAGVYNVVPEGADSGGTRFVVNPDTRESESLEQLADEQINAQLGFAPEHITSGEQAVSRVDSIRNRNEWTIYVLALLLLLAFFETIWAWYCGKAW